MHNNWLIALDLDGTLFQTDHQLSSRTLNTLQKVIDRGHTVLINTGRSSFSSVPRLSRLPSEVRLICSNGAYEYDRIEQSISWSNLIAASTARKIQHSILEHLPNASFGWETVVGLTYESRFVDEAGGADTLESGGCDTALGEHDLLKLFVRTPEQKGAELVNTLQRQLSSGIEVSSSGVPFVEITAPGINKGSALARIAVELGFKQQNTMAFGDNLNDAPMLQWAGESVAMDNAIDEVKAISGALTLSNAEDGVAHYLERRLLKS